MSDFLKQSGCRCAFAGSGAWVVLSEIEQSIKRKIETVGKPLKDWDINIYRGILTGYNDAFIITTGKRDEILSNCKDEEERSKTCEIIRPILRGRDIKRYGYDWANLWLINTHNGVKGKIPRIDINDYPAIKAHLDQYWDKIKDRADQGDTPYNLRNCAYLEDFGKPKIVWAELARSGNAFVLDLNGHLVGNTGYILTVPDNDIKKLTFLLAFLNSRVVLYCLNLVSTRFDDNGWRWLRQFVEMLLIPPFNDSELYNQLIEIAHEANSANQNIASESINGIVYEILGFSEEEKKYIDNDLNGY